MSLNTSLSIALSKLKELFPDKSKSWFRRCVLRLDDVHSIYIGDDIEQWVVRGNPRLGDKYRFYIVTIYPKEGKHICSCYEPNRKYGRYRLKSVCTHVGAVYLYKIINKRDIKIKMK